MGFHLLVAYTEKEKSAFSGSLLLKDRRYFVHKHSIEKDELLGKTSCHKENRTKLVLK